MIAEHAEKAGVRDPHEHAELIALYEQSAENIREFQRRQYIVTNLVVLVYAGLVGFVKTMEPPVNVVNIVAGSLAVAGGAGVVWICSLQNAMQRARGVLRRAQMNFSPQGQAVITGTDAPVKPIERDKRKLNLSWVFILVIVVGWVLAMFVLGKF